MSASPKVSVILPTYNRGHLIEKSIKSVLNQSYNNLELIIVDDCSSDKTEIKIQEIKDNRLVYIRNQRNLGPSKSRNNGIKLSTGDLIAFQDSDDEWHLDKLQKQVALLQKSTNDVAAVYCGMEFFDLKSEKKIGEELREMNFKEAYINGSFFFTPANVTVLIKKDVLNDVGYFDDRLFADEDTELAIRVTKKYNYAFLNEVLVRVNRNHNQLTGNAKNYANAKEIIYEKHRDYLSSKNLFHLCKEIANYYILKDDYKKANEFVRKSLMHEKNLLTFFQYLALNFSPFLIRYAFKRKYKYGMPHPNELGKFIPLDDA